MVCVCVNVSVVCSGEKFSYLYFQFSSLPFSSGICKCVFVWCWIVQFGSRERGEWVSESECEYVCLSERALVSREAVGTVVVWKGAGELRTSGEWRMRDVKLSFQALLLNCVGLQMLLQGLTEKWTTLARSKDQRVPIQPYSVVWKASAHPASSISHHYFH